MRALDDQTWYWWRTVEYYCPNSLARSFIICILKTEVCTNTGGRGVARSLQINNAPVIGIDFGLQEMSEPWWHKQLRRLEKCQEWWETLSFFPSSLLHFQPKCMCDICARAHARRNGMSKSRELYDSHIGHMSAGMHLLICVFIQNLKKITQFSECVCVCARAHLSVVVI